MWPDEMWWPVMRYDEMGSDERELMINPTKATQMIQINFDGPIHSVYKTETYCVYWCMRQKLVVEFLCIWFD